MTFARPKKVLSVFSLVAINVIAVDSLRAFPISAEYGLSLIFYYLLGAVFFMMPVAFAAAEMASAWPQEGGVYVWVREALGVRCGFFVAWLQWVYNIVWYPTVLSFLVSTLFYVFSPHLAYNKTAVLITLFVTFWLATMVNLLGMRASNIISQLGAIVGTFLPIALIILLSLAWWFSKKPILLAWHPSQLLPHARSLRDLALLSGMLFGLVGIEMSAVHAKDVQNPQKDYPKALLISTIIILLTSILASLAIAWIIPLPSLNLSVALVRSFSIYLTAFHVHWLLPIIALCIIFGGLSSVSAWVIGPGKCMMCACRGSGLWLGLLKLNRHDVPSRLLLVQGLLFTMFCLMFWFSQGFNAAYWLLSDMTAELAAIFYMFLFISFFVLRKKFPQKERPYQVPGGLLGARVISYCGLLTCVFVFLCGLLPPLQIHIASGFNFVLTILFGVGILCFLPWFFTRQR